MMPGAVFRQGTLLIPTGPTHHLHIVMNDSVFSHEHGYEAALVVNISSVKPGCFFDGTCILQPGCHPFVIRDSWVFYGDAVVLDAGRMLTKVDAGEFVTHAPVSDGVFAQVRSGFDLSKHVRPKIKRFIKQHGI